MTKNNFTVINECRNIRHFQLVRQTVLNKTLDTVLGSEAVDNLKISTF